MRIIGFFIICAALGALTGHAGISPMTWQFYAWCAPFWLGGIMAIGGAKIDDENL